MLLKKKLIHCLQDDIDDFEKTEGMQKTTIIKGMISNETVCEQNTNKNDDSLIIVGNFTSFPEDSSQFTKYELSIVYFSMLLTFYVFLDLIEQVRT